MRNWQEIAVEYTVEPSTRRGCPLRCSEALFECRRATDCDDMLGRHNVAVNQESKEESAANPGQRDLRGIFEARCVIDRCGGLGQKPEQQVMKLVCGGRGVVVLRIEGEAGNCPVRVVRRRRDRAPRHVPRQHINGDHMQLPRLQDTEVVGLSTLREEPAEVTDLRVAAGPTNDVEYRAMLHLDDRVDEAITPLCGGAQVEVGDVVGRRSVCKTDDALVRGTKRAQVSLQLPVMHEKVRETVTLGATPRGGLYMIGRPGQGQHERVGQMVAQCPVTALTHRCACPRKYASRYRDSVRDRRRTFRTRVARVGPRFALSLRIPHGP